MQKIFQISKFISKSEFERKNLQARKTSSDDEVHFKGVWLDERAEEELGHETGQIEGALGETDLSFGQTQAVCVWGDNQGSDAHVDSFCHE